MSGHAQTPSRETAPNELISVVVPCYNEAAILEELYSRLTAACESWGTDWEVVVVDDGSSDGSLALLREFARRDPRWRYLSLSRNFGHQTALSAGIDAARGFGVVCIDADLQDPPEEIARLIEKWHQGYDVVYAVRRKRKESLPKRAAYWLFYRTMKYLAELDDMPLDAGDFCIMSRRVVEVIKASPEQNRFVRGLRAWAGFRQIGIEYERPARAGGEPKYTFKKLLNLALDGLCSFSGKPLRLAAKVGFLISTLAMAGIAFAFVQRLIPAPFEALGLPFVPGYASTIIAILFLGGLQLIFLGVIGSYLYRVFEEVKSRPGWVVKEESPFERLPAGGKEAASAQRRSEQSGP